MITDANWIGLPKEFEAQCPIFKKLFKTEKSVLKAELSITAIGVYEAVLNGKRVGNFILAPGVTSYSSRLQYQTYDITALLKLSNELTITVGSGWHRGRISVKCENINSAPCAVLVEMSITYTDGEAEKIVTDGSWSVAKSKILQSDIYDGEIYDATLSGQNFLPAAQIDFPKTQLISQEGAYVTEQETVFAAKHIITPKGEHVLDFGQNFAGYPEFTLTAKKGERVRLSFAEILDYEGNFYNENYRSAKAQLEYICTDGEQTFKPHFTYYGFRYIRVDEFPGDISSAAFRGIALYSDMERTGNVKSANAKLNKLFENTLWSQRSNFVDIPTDCPQRDERMGWTGDAQIFCKTASYNYNVLQFFSKWLADVRAEQRKDGAVIDIAPNFWKTQGTSTAWGDVICIVPWQMYLMYGDTKILKDNFDAMKGWVDYITSDSADRYLWTSDKSDENSRSRHYGDWLALDAPYGSYRGITNPDFIATAFYSYSTKLVVKAGKVLGRDVSEYERLYENIIKAAKKTFKKLSTQTDHVLALVFDLCDDKKSVADSLAQLIRENGNKLKTGFVGTPYLLHALSENGYTETAYALLLQEDYPSWLYEVNHGATTIWEHWDGIRDDGQLWSKNMNSYNHYAYGSVMDWVYSVAAGIKPDEAKPGFEKAIISPTANKELGWLDVSLKTSRGTIRSAWTVTDSGIRYEIETPTEAEIIIDGKTHPVGRGSYVFYA